MATVTKTLSKIRALRKTIRSCATKLNNELEILIKDEKSTVEDIEDTLLLLQKRQVELSNYDKQVEDILTAEDEIEKEVLERLEYSDMITLVRNRANRRIQKAGTPSISMPVPEVNVEPPAPANCCRRKKNIGNNPPVEDKQKLNVTKYKSSVDDNVDFSKVELTARRRSQSAGIVGAIDKNRPNRSFQRSFSSQDSFIPKGFYIKYLEGVIMINPIFNTLAFGKNAKSCGVSTTSCCDETNGSPQNKDAAFEKLSQTMVHVYHNSLTEVYPLNSDQEFAINFKNVYADPQVLETPLRSVGMDECRRIYVQAPFGGGKRTYLQKIVSDLACSNCPCLKGRPYRLQLLFDISKFDNDLKTKSMESVLLHMCDQYSTFANFDDLKETIKRYSKHILCLFSGYETLSVESRKTMQRFFRRDIGTIENPHVFRSSSFILASADVFESFPKMFRSSFDTLLVLQGIPLERNVALLLDILGVEKAANMRERLNNLKMTFLLDNSQILPQVVLLAGYFYKKYGAKDRCHFLGKIIKRQLVEYFGYHNQQNLTDRAIKAKAEEILIRIGRQVYKMMEETENSFFNVSACEMSDVKILSNLGWIDFRTLQPTHRLPLEYFVVKYLNSTIAGISLDDAFLHFAQQKQTSANVIVRTEGENRYLKHMYVTSSRNLFVLNQHRVQNRFAINYFMYEDFQDVLDQEKSSLFSIKVTKRADLKLGLLQSRFSVCPIKFNGDHFVTTLMDCFTDEVTMLVKYPVEKHWETPITPNKSSYSYCVNVNEVKNAFTFSLNFYQDDCKTVANFVSGFNQVLLNIHASVPFSISQKSLRIHLNDLCNALKLLHVCFTLERDQNDHESNAQLLHRCATHFNDNFTGNSWVMTTGEIPIATSDDILENENHFAHPLPDLTNQPLELVLNLTE